MQINTTIYGEDGTVTYRNVQSVDALMLTIAAESREKAAREGGASFTQAGINVFASELIKQVRAGEPKKALEMTITNMALTTWLFESLFCGATTETFIGLNLTYTIYPGGIVQLDKAPAPK